MFVYKSLRVPYITPEINLWLLLMVYIIQLYHWHFHKPSYKTRERVCENNVF